MGEPAPERSEADTGAPGPDVPESDGPGTGEPETDEPESVAPTTGVGAPSVVAVVITRNPGEWLEPCLASLMNQDYERLSVLVVDNGSLEDPTERVAEAAPGVFVKRLKSDDGFSAAANEAARSIEGAPFLLFCHDDVLLATDAVTNLVAEAFRANAGIVGPKLVDWEDPNVLRSVGIGVDAYGAASTLIDQDELDQGQHDTARGVFAVSSAVMLVRADLFRSIEGFDPRIPFFGEDVDLCWRTHAAGAAVRFCPRAVAGHLGRFSERRPSEVRDRMILRHETRSTLVNHELRTLVKVAPVGFLMSILEWLAYMLTGRFRSAADVMAIWVWTILHTGELLGARRRVRRYRRASDASFKDLQRRGSSRMRELTRSSDGESRMSIATRVGTDKLKVLRGETPPRLAMAIGIGALVVMLVGARGAIFGSLPSMREFTSAGDSAGAWLSEWWNSWRRAGLGEAAIPPGVVPSLGWVGTIFLGAVGAARRLLIILPLFFGPLGAWRLFRNLDSSRTRAVAFAVYGLSPIALNAFGEARLQAIIAWAAAPWILRRVASAAGVEPVAEGDDTRARPSSRLAGTALILALVFAISPLAATIVTLTCIVVVLGPALMGQAPQAFRAIRSVVLAYLAAAIVSVPWIYEGIRTGDLATFTGIWPSGVEIPSAAEMLTGDIGPTSTGILGWGLVAAAAVSLFTGRRWRLGWSLGGWFAILISLFGAILAGQAEWVGGAGVAMFLTPLALGLAVATAMGPAAFESDVVEADFGYQQILSFLGIGALLVGFLPLVGGAINGRWQLPEGDFDRSLSIVDDTDDLRALWIGDSDLLPVSGWELDGAPGVNFGFSHGLSPEMMERYRLDGGAGVEAVQSYLSAALDGHTSGIGQLLAPMSVGYVVVVDRPAPGPFAEYESRAAHEIASALGEQLDLRLIPTAVGVSLYEVAVPWPSTTDVTDLALPPEGSPALQDQLASQLTDPEQVFPPGFSTSYSAEVPPGIDVAQSVTGDPGWTMTIDGEPADRAELFGWGQRFNSAEGGSATLAFTPPVTFRTIQVLQLVLLAGLLFVAFRRGTMPAPRRRRRAVATEPVVVVDEPGPELAGWQPEPARSTFDDLDSERPPLDLPPEDPDLEIVSTEDPEIVVPEDPESPS